MTVQGLYLWQVHKAYAGLWLRACPQIAMKLPYLVGLVCRFSIAAECPTVCMQRNTTGDDGLELWPDSASAANIGIMLFRRGAGKLAKVRLTCLPSHVHSPSILLGSSGLMRQVWAMLVLPRMGCPEEVSAVQQNACWTLHHQIS